jgi:molybdopterin converting factor small subunit
MFLANVKLNLLNIFQLRINKKYIYYEGKTVKDIINQFLKENKTKLDVELLDKNKKKFNSHVLILLNGRNIKYLNNYKTALNDGDELYISYALAGG